MAGKKSVLTVTLLLMISLTSCGEKTLPDYAPDIVCTVYQTMKSDKTFKMHGKLTLSMRIGEKESTYLIDTTVISTEHPYEVVVKRQMMNEGEDLGTEYEYYNEQLDDAHSYVLSGEVLKKQEKEKVEAYQYPIPFGIYFKNVKSFQELATTKGETILRGEIVGEGIEYALQESGVLKRFMLTGLSEETIGRLEGIKVKAWVKNKERVMTKVEADMTEAVKSMVAEMYGNHGPEVVLCIYEIDQVELKRVAKPEMPFDINALQREKGAF